METKEIQSINIEPKENYSFGLTSFIWHEMPITQLDLDGLENLLEERIQLSDYGKGLKQIMVGFVVYPNNMPMQKAGKKERFFSKRKKIVSISVELDYNKLLIANSEEAFEIIKKAYYQTIVEVLPTFNIKYFNVESFLADLKKIVLA